MPLEVLVRAVGEAWAEAWPAVFWVRPHFPPFRPPCAAYELRGPTKPSHKSKRPKRPSSGLKRAKFLARGQCTAQFLSSARESSRRVFLTLQFLNAYQGLYCSNGGVAGAPPLPSLEISIRNSDFIEMPGHLEIRRRYP